MSHWPTSTLGTLKLGQRFAQVPLYFFDTRDGDMFIRDDGGEQLPDLDAAKRAAASLLAGLAREVIPESEKRILTVEVRDAGGRQVIEARLTFEAITFS